MSSSNPFEVREGGCQIIHSACAVMLRRQGDGWQVLMMDSEVINWLKSTPRKLVPMRYGGEWRLPGGNMDPGETPEQTARRELEEEVLSALGAKVPESAVFRPFTVQQTRPIRSRSNIIYYFAVLEDENPWLRDLDVAMVNAALAARKKRFGSVFVSQTYADMTLAEKEQVAPELHSLQWMTPRSAQQACRAGLTKSGEGQGFASEFQRSEYKQWGLTRNRDPTYMTMWVLAILEAQGTREKLVAASDTIKDLAAEAKRVQWIFPGMTTKDVDEALLQRSTYRKKETKLTNRSKL